METQQERGVSAVMLGLMFIPGEDVEAAGSRVAEQELTKRMVGDYFALRAQFAFGHGGDRPSYVSAKCSLVRPVRNAGN